MWLYVYSCEYSASTCWWNAITYVHVCISLCAWNLMWRAAEQQSWGLKLHPRLEPLCPQFIPRFQPHLLQTTPLFCFLNPARANISTSWHPHFQGFVCNRRALHLSYFRQQSVVVHGNRKEVQPIRTQITVHARHNGASRVKASCESFT